MGTEPEAEQPPAWILIDVDGVLNPDFRCKPPYCSCHPRWIRRKALGLYRIYLNPEHGPKLARLAADTGAKLAWGTTWEHAANRWIAPEIGLPDLPWAPAAWGARKGMDCKAEGIVPWTAGTPFVWFEDEPDEKKEAARLASQPHLVVTVDPRQGLTDGNIAEARDWLMNLRKGN